MDKPVRTYTRMYGHTFLAIRENNYTKQEDVFEWAAVDKEAKQMFESAEDNKYFWLAARDAFNDYNDQIARGVKEPTYHKPLSDKFYAKYK